MFTNKTYNNDNDLYKDSSNDKKIRVNKRVANIVAASGVIGHHIDADVEKELWESDSCTSEESTDKGSENDIPLNEMAKRYNGTAKKCSKKIGYVTIESIGDEEESSNNELSKVSTVKRVVPGKKANKLTFGDRLKEKSRLRLPCNSKKIKK